MWATVYHRPLINEAQPTGSGHFERAQDPDTGAVNTIWVPNAADANGNLFQASQEIRCYARGYTALGYRSSANREIYVKGDYDLTEAIQFDFSRDVVLTHQSLVTNIRNRQDPTDGLLWLNEDTAQSIVWEVQGVTPVHDPFGKWIRNTTVLKRAEIQ